MSVDTGITFIGDDLAAARRVALHGVELQAGHITLGESMLEGSVLEELEALRIRCQLSGALESGKCLAQGRPLGEEECRVLADDAEWLLKFASDCIHEPGVDLAWCSAAIGDANRVLTTIRAAGRPPEATP